VKAIGKPMKMAANSTAKASRPRISLLIRSPHLYLAQLAQATRQ
jgi:hypothetical protein